MEKITGYAILSIMKLRALIESLKQIRLTKKQIIWIGILLAIVAALVALYLIGKNLGWFTLFESPKELRAYVMSFGVWAPLAFFTLQFIQVIISPIPGSVTSLVGGMLFGFFYGFLITFAAVFLGSICAFLLGKLFGRPLAERIAGKKAIDKYMTTVSSRQRVVLILMFLFPFFPDDLLCLVAGLTPLRLPSFALIVLLTRPWGLVVSSLIGAGTISLPFWIWIIIALATLIFFVLGTIYAPHIEERVRVWMERKYKKAS